MTRNDPAMPIGENGNKLLDKLPVHRDWYSVSRDGAELFHAPMDMVSRILCWYKEAERRVMYDIGRKGYAEAYTNGRRVLGWADEKPFVIKPVTCTEIV
jgi:hypothetical protein